MHQFACGEGACRKAVLTLFNHLLLQCISATGLDEVTEGGRCVNKCDLPATITALAKLNAGTCFSSAK